MGGASSQHAQMPTDQQRLYLHQSLVLGHKDDFALDQYTSSLLVDINFWNEHCNTHKVNLCVHRPETLV